MSVGVEGVEVVQPREDKLSGDTADTLELLKSVAILVVDDEPGMRNFLRRALEGSCALLEVAESVEEAESLRSRYHFDLLIVDVCLQGRNGIQWLQDLREQGVRTNAIFMTAYADLQTAIDAIRTGAEDFIIKPFRVDQMIASVRQSIMRRQMLRENLLLKRQLDKLFVADGIIGNSEAIQETCQLARRVAPTHSTILIQGETGTGKELIARAIHDISACAGAFVPINCGTISPELLESELFGHVKGAFTGAQSSREGLFVYANEGTLFLDEIGEMPLQMQSKLLRVLEERVVRPVGSEREMPFNGRVVAATNKNLAQEVSEGSFREDLFYRLNVLPIDMPPLRARITDIPALVEYFSDSLARELGVPAVEFTHADFVRLQQYHWPGNVRELKNLMERTLLLGKLPDNWLPPDSGHSGHSDYIGYPLEWKIEEVEKAHIRAVMESVNENKSEAARRLGVSRKTLERKEHQWAEEANDANVR